jgi:hypothetical protein
VRKFTNIRQALRAVYPQYDLQQYHKFKFKHTSQGSPVSKSQLALLKRVNELFTGTPIQLNFRYEIQDSAKNKKNFEFDVSFHTPQ